MLAEVRCLTCGATGWCRVSNSETFELRDDYRLAEVCAHLPAGGEYEGTGKVEYED